MKFEESRKVLLITDNKRIETPIKQALNKHGLNIATSYLNLYSLSVIRKAIASTGKTAFMRTALMRFIKENGFPYAVIIDSTITTGQDTSIASDELKILKTLLISYIILSRGSEFEKLQGNYIILTRGNSFDDRYKLSTTPHKILDLLKTANEGVNRIIDTLKNDQKSFNSLFFIKLLDSESSSDEITMFMDNYINGIEVKKKLSGTDKITAFEDNDNPARVVFKINDETVFNDGEIIPVESNRDTPINDNEFYIIGPWSNKTHREVSDKLAVAIIKGLADRKRFKKEEPITINLDDRCTVDGTTAASLAQVLIKKLNDYKKITVCVSARNDEILKKAQGFSMIKNIVRRKD